MIQPDTNPRSPLLVVITIILIVAALRWSYPVTMPIAVALFVIGAAWPIKRWLERILPSSLSYVGTALLLFLILGSFLVTIYVSIAQVTQTLLDNQDRFRALFDTYAEWAGKRQLPVPGGDGGYDRLVAVAQVLFWRMYAMCGYLGLIAILVIMGLPEVPALSERIGGMLRARENQELIMTVEQICEKFRQYMGVTVLTSLITGVASLGWAFAVGLDLALIWGVLNFLLNFVPVLGNIIGIIPPTLYALIQYENSTMAAVVFAGFAILQLIISNIVYPLLQGRGMAMPPVAIILALLFWGWIWGAVGALLAVPLTAAIIIVCQHFRSTEWVARLLKSDE